MSAAITAEVKAAWKEEFRLRIEAETRLQLLAPATSEDEPAPARRRMA
jgi:hypothetical protein